MATPKVSLSTALKQASIASATFVRSFPSVSPFFTTCSSALAASERPVAPKTAAEPFMLCAAAFVSSSSPVLSPFLLRSVAERGARSLGHLLPSLSLRMLQVRSRRITLSSPWLPRTPCRIPQGAPSQSLRRPWPTPSLLASRLLLLPLAFLYSLGFITS